MGVNMATVDAELKSAVTETLKSLPGFEALMAEAAKRLAEVNHNKSLKDNEEDDKEKNDDHNRMKDNR